MSSERRVPVVLVLNQRAGSLAGMPRPRAALEAAITHAGFHLIATAPEAATLAAQWRIALASQALIVFVAGGDGTLSAAAARLKGTRFVLAPVPGGTMNRYATSLSLPPEPLAAIAAHAKSAVRTVPLASMNGVPFLYQCVAGRVARLMRVREQVRGSGQLGWIRLLRAVLREFLRRPARSALVARIAGRRRARAHTAVVEAPAPGAAQVLSLNLAPPGTLKVRLRQAWRWFRGRLAEDPDILMREASCMAIGSAAPRVRVSLDGEARLARTPLHFRLHRDALRLLAPP